MHKERKRSIQRERERERERDVFVCFLIVYAYAERLSFSFSRGENGERKQMFQKLSDGTKIINDLSITFSGEGVFWEDCRLCSVVQPPPLLVDIGINVYSTLTRYMRTKMGLWFASFKDSNYYNCRQYYFFQYKSRNHTPGFSRDLNCIFFGFSHFPSMYF